MIALKSIGEAARQAFPATENRPVSTRPPPISDLSPAALSGAAGFRSGGPPAGLLEGIARLV
jgi:hypothetical protein